MRPLEHQTAAILFYIGSIINSLVVYFTSQNNEQCDNKLAVLFMEHKVFFTVSSIRESTFLNKKGGIWQYL